MRKSAALRLSALFVLSATIASGQAPAPAASASPSSVPKIEFEKYTLPNGLQVILHVDRKLPIVHVNQWFHVGSKNEKPGRTGFAHLFEHMMFQGSKNAPKRLLHVRREGRRQPRRRAASTARPNNDRTNYFATVPSGNLETLLWLESDRLATLPDALTKEKLDNQRDVVKNERRQGLENTPYGRWFKLVTGEPPSGRPSLLVDRHRQPRGPHGGVARRRQGLLQAPTTRRTTSRSSSPATSTRRRRSGSSRSTSAPSPPGPPLDRPDALRSRRSTARRSSKPPTASRRTAST